MMAIATEIRRYYLVGIHDTNSCFGPMEACCARGDRSRSALSLFTLADRHQRSAEFRNQAESTWIVDSAILHIQKKMGCEEPVTEDFGCSLFRDDPFAGPGLQSSTFRQRELGEWATEDPFDVRFDFDNNGLVRTEPDDPTTLSMTGRTSYLLT